MTGGALQITGNAMFGHDFRSYLTSGKNIRLPFVQISSAEVCNLTYIPFTAKLRHVAIVFNKPVVLSLVTDQVDKLNEIYLTSVVFGNML